MNSKDRFLARFGSAEHLDTAIDHSIKNADDNSDLTENPHINKSHVDKLVNHPNEYVRESLAYKDYLLEPHHINKFVEDFSHKVRAAISYNRDLQPHHVESLVNDTAPLVRRLISHHPNLQSHHVDKLINDENPGVIEQIASSRNLSPIHHEKLSNHSSSSIRSIMATHPDVKGETLDKLVNDPNRHVRAATMQNRNLTKKHLHSLKVSDPIMGRAIDNKLMSGLCKDE